MKTKPTIAEIIDQFVALRLCWAYGKESCQNIIENAKEWIAVGWQLDDEPTLEQLAAAMLMEATDQDGCVARNESAPEFPIFLRRFAFHILHSLHGKQP
jgi:hypothetical protein